MRSGLKTTAQFSPREVRGKRSGIFSTTLGRGLQRTRPTRPTGNECRPTPTVMNVPAWPFVLPIAPAPRPAGPCRQSRQATAPEIQQPKARARTGDIASHQPANGTSTSSRNGHDLILPTFAGRVGSRHFLDACRYRAGLCVPRARVGNACGHPPRRLCQADLRHHFPEHARGATRSTSSTSARPTRTIHWAT